MIDACHIVPFAESYNDTIENGISLCPNLHRAFDRGLLTINENYEVIISDSFSESHNEYSLRQYAGTTILLPAEKKYHPLTDNLTWHQRHVFKR